MPALSILPLSGASDGVPLAMTSTPVEVHTGSDDDNVLHRLVVYAYNVSGNARTFRLDVGGTSFPNRISLSISANMEYTKIIDRLLIPGDSGGALVVNGSVDAGTSEIAVVGFVEAVDQNP